MEPTEAQAKIEAARDWRNALPGRRQVANDRDLIDQASDHIGNLLDVVGAATAEALAAHEELETLKKEVADAQKSKE